MKLRKWTAEEKMAIVLEGIKGQKSVAEICREHQISQTLFYRWRDRFLEGGQRNLTNGGRAEEADALRAEIEKLQKIIGPADDCHRGFKKNPRASLWEAVKLMREKGESLKGACKRLGVSRTGYYGKSVTGRMPTPLNQELVEKIKALRLAHPFWGYRRMTAWLRYREGYAVNHKRIQKLMKENGLGVDQTRHQALRKSQRAKPKATQPKQYWGIDMTKFLLGPLGWCYLIIVLDWNLSLRARTAEWKEALDRALGEHFPWGVRGRGLNLVSDNGSQPTSVSFMTDMALLGINQIFCSYDNPKGNAETERVIRTIKEELLWLNDFTSFEQAYEAIEAWIANDYNQLYVHSALGYRSPLEYRQQWEQRQSLIAVFGGC